MRKLLAFILMAAASSATLAAERSYAVLSIMGDRLMITQYNPQTGSRLDRNAKTFLPLNNDALDRTALRAVKSEIEKREPGARVELLAASDASFYAAVNQALDAGGVEAVIAKLRPELKGIDTTHWVLVTKHRGEARAPMFQGTVGSGTFEGLGFYIDRWRDIRNVETGETTEGFLTPFAYLRFTLVEAATGKVVRDDAQMRSATAARQKATHPWDALSADEKVAMLDHLIRDAATTAVPKLLAP